MLLILDNSPSIGLGSGYQLPKAFSPTEKELLRLRAEGDAIMKHFADTAFDAFAYIPVIGEPIDAFNAVRAAFRGDWDEAALNATSMIPFVGNVVGKGGKAVKGITKASKVIDKADDIADIAKGIDKVDDIADATKAIKSGTATGNDVYAGVKEASEFLKSQNVPREYRKQILESFDVRTIKMETTGDATYGIRFYGGDAKEKGRYLFETFSPTTNRNNLALPNQWNSMSGLQQFQVKSGTPMITGNAAPQLQYGSQYVGGAKQWYINSLEALSK